eukprot:4318256-Pyramimonas_sp.AAC.1
MRYAPIAEHLYFPAQPGPTDFTPTWLVGVLLGAWRRVASQPDTWASCGFFDRADLGDEMHLRPAVATLALLCSAPESWALEACLGVRRILRTCPDRRLGGWSPPQLYREDPIAHPPPHWRGPPMNRPTTTITIGPNTV